VNWPVAVITGIALTVIVAVGLALALDEPPPSSGYVTEKKYTPQSQWVEYVCTVRDASSGMCIMTTAVTHTRPEVWQLCLRADDDPRRTGCLDVPDRTWDRYEVGQHYPEAR